MNKEVRKFVKKAKKIFKKNERNMLYLFLYFFATATIILLFVHFKPFGSSDLEREDTVDDISVQVVHAEDTVCSGSDAAGTEFEFPCNKVGFYAPDTGEYVELTLDFLIEHQFIRKGDKIFVYTFDNQTYSYSGVDRRPPLLLLGAIFVLATIITGGMLGVRSLFSLILSAVVIIFGLIPLIDKGYNPIVVILISGTIMLAISLFFLYGFRKSTVIALVGTLFGLVISLVISVLFANAFKLTGRGDEFANYLRLNFALNFDIRDLILGGFILGTLGVVDDATISQVYVVEELLKAKKRFSVKKLYFAAMRVGKTHVASMVNTLFMAYISVALPLVLILVLRNYSFAEIAKREDFTIEILRTLAGSIGLILTVPITTLLAAVVLKRQQEKNA